MDGEPTFAMRRAGEEDSRACFGVFRASLRDFMRRTGYSSQPDDAEEAWPGYRPLFGHLAATAAEWWVAEDESGGIVGYARSLLREEHVELTELFVRPEVRVAGTGRALLERAFAPGWGRHRSIVATLDAPAVALYLRFGVRHQDTTAGFLGRPGRAEPGPGLEVEDAGIDEVLAIEREVLGHSRPEDIAFISSTRPAVVARRGRHAIGYAFLPDGDGRAGPVAARRPEDVPVLLALVERAAHEAGRDELAFNVPLSAAAAVEWLLHERRFRLDPFYALLLADGDWAGFDRYLPFNPTLFL